MLAWESGDLCSIPTLASDLGESLHFSVSVSLIHLDCQLFGAGTVFDCMNVRYSTEHGVAPISLGFLGATMKQMGDIQ